MITGPTLHFACLSPLDTPSELAADIVASSASRTPAGRVTRLCWSPRAIGNAIPLISNCLAESWDAAAGSEVLLALASADFAFGTALLLFSSLLVRLLPLSAVRIVVVEPEKAPEPWLLSGWLSSTRDVSLLKSVFTCRHCAASHS